MQLVDPAAAMREGMRRLASGVCVVSSSDAEQNPFAMTATSVTSVSDAPASLLVCVNSSASIQQAINARGRFCINLLHRGQEEISNVCSRDAEGASRLRVGNWDTSGELPFLRDCLAAFFCRTDHSMDYGTHRIFIGQIEAVQIDAEADIDPLVYLNGSYRSLR